MSKKDWQLLKAYQATGLTPEQVSKLAQKKQMEDSVIMVFSDRRKIASLFDAWAKTNNIAICPENVLAFLQVHKLLKVKELKALAKGESSVVELKEVTE